MSILTETQALLAKDVKLEWRNKNTLFSLLLFSGGTVFIAYLSFYLKTKLINSITWNALLWILLLFNAIHGMAKSFAQESANRNIYYYYLVRPQSIYLSKFLYNSGLMLVLSMLSYVFLAMVFEVDIQNRLYFFITLISGAIAFSGTLTLVSAIASKAGNNSTLMAVLSIPVIIPLLIILIRISNNAIDGINPALMGKDLYLLVAINLIIITISYLLFPYLWKS